MSRATGSQRFLHHKCNAAHHELHDPNVVQDGHETAEDDHCWQNAKCKRLHHEHVIAVNLFVRVGEKTKDKSASLADKMLKPFDS